MTSTAVPADTLSAIAARRSMMIGYLYAIIGALLFASKGILIKLVYQHGLDAETILTLRMLFSLPFYLVIGIVTVAEYRRIGRALPGIGLVVKSILVGLLGYWLSAYLDFIGLETISAQFERLILYTYPFWVVLFGVAFFGQRAKPTALLGFVVSYAGLALIFTQMTAAPGQDVVFGVLVILGAAIAFALYQLFAKNLIATVGPQLFTCIAMIGAAAIIIGQFALTHPISALAVNHTVLIYSIILAVGTAVLPAFFMNAALQRISAQANATIGMLSPVCTIFLAMGILGEMLTPTDWVGTVLVIAGIAWFTVFDRRKAETTAEAAVN
ncbi:DMT family transporter [Kaistia dalseonensis]|uniref:Drug/metabolite transporter (DMT)-like permease n=1 Tax=Kaistia dalseonensis TaxID=410840 RepID=A0ABU0H635_9HYPH|nr:DMT family transporter [Kaistia dalseonensis]MCX5494335.1 DMT family transporter [Kaistia dalseonensis]MDQ0436916.1 drug/metabolite transporter (DMT)-like permease [Kaistia dalseonensis]